MCVSLGKENNSSVILVLYIALMFSFLTCFCHFCVFLHLALICFYFSFIFTNFSITTSVSCKVSNTKKKNCFEFSSNIYILFYSQIGFVILVYIYEVIHK